MDARRSNDAGQGMRDRARKSSASANSVMRRPHRVPERTLGTSVERRLHDKHTEEHCFGRHVGKSWENTRFVRLSAR